MENNNKKILNEYIIDQVKEFYAASLSALDNSKCYKYTTKKGKRRSKNNITFDSVDINCIDREPTDEDVILNVPGVYFIFNKDHKIIYIGESAGLRRRINDHYTDSNNFLKDINKDDTYIKIITTDKDDIHERRAIEELSYYILIDKNDPLYHYADPSKKSK